MQEQTDGPVSRQNKGRLCWCLLRSYTESGRGLRKGLWVQMEGWESSLPLCLPKVPRPLTLMHSPLGSQSLLDSLCRCNNNGTSIPFHMGHS